MQSDVRQISKFWVAGVNYKKTDAATRGKFAIQHDQYLELLKKASVVGLSQLFVLSTCNRTEIYGFADNISQLVNLLCQVTVGDEETFLSSAYLRNGFDAIEHLFNVSAGLDSQILGDYEIIGQIKTAVKFAKEQECIDVFLDRLINTVLQSSKAIKNETGLSGGTVSVSFAAIQYIRDNVKNISGKKILLLGTGKIGRSACRNLVHYLKTKKITLINRTEEKAIELAKELDIQYAPMSELQEYISASDIIVVATDSAEPTVLASQLQGQSQKLVIDLSMPNNVEAAARHLSNIILINVDELSRQKDETLARRVSEIPKAREIIIGHIAEFTDWYEMRKHVPLLKAVKTKLKEIHNSPLFIPLYNNPARAEEKIQRIVNGTAYKMKGQNQKGCYYIEAINEFIAAGSN